MIEYRTERIAEATVIRLTGEIDLANARELQRRLELLAKSTHLVVDLAAVTYLDLSGVRVLEHIHAFCQARQRLLVLTSPSLRLLRLFDLVHIRKHIQVFDSREEASAYVRGK